MGIAKYVKKGLLILGTMFFMVSNEKASFADIYNYDTNGYDESDLLDSDFQEWRNYSQLPTENFNQSYNLTRPIVEIHSYEPILMNKSADENSEVIANLYYDGVFLLTGEESGWYKIKYDGQEGYIKQNHDIQQIQNIKLSEGLDKRANIVVQAYNMLGTKYMLGGQDDVNGYDCSSLIQKIYRDAVGMSLPRTTKEQIKQGTAITSDQLRPGDLIFYGSSMEEDSVNHVAVYIGNGKIIHAQGTGLGVTVGYWDGNPNHIKFVSMINE